MGLLGPTSAQFTIGDDKIKNDLHVFTFSQTCSSFIQGSNKHNNRQHNKYFPCCDIASTAMSSTLNVKQHRTEPLSIPKGKFPLF